MSENPKEVRGAVTVTVSRELLDDEDIGARMKSYNAELAKHLEESKLKVEAYLAGMVESAVAKARIDKEWHKYIHTEISDALDKELKSRSFIDRVEHDVNWIIRQSREINDELGRRATVWLRRNAPKLVMSAVMESILPKKKGRTSGK